MSVRVTPNPSAPRTRLSARVWAFGRSLVHDLERTRVTAAFRARRLVPDELIPGTLNIGHTPPTIVQAVIYITVIAVDRPTLALLIAAAVVGAWFGAGIVSGWDCAVVGRNGSSPTSGSSSQTPTRASSS